MTDTPRTDAERAFSQSMSSHAMRLGWMTHFCGHLERETAMHCTELNRLRAELQQAENRLCDAGEQIMLLEANSECLEREKAKLRHWLGEIFGMLGLPNGDMGALETLAQKLKEARR